jgi:hypothetical protein
MHATTDRGLARSILPAIVTIAAGALVAGCGDDDKKAADAKPAAFAINASAAGKKKVIEFPATVKAGVVAMTLTNADKGPRSAQIIRMEGDHTVDEVLKIVDADNVKIPAWFKDGGGVNTVDPGGTGTITQVLAPGHYAIWDDEGGDDGAPGNDKLGAKGEFTVTGEATDAKLPAVAGSVTAIDEEGAGDKETYSFETSGLKAGVNTVRFQTKGDQLHHALFLPMNKGATLADVKKFAISEGNSPGPPPVDFANAQGTNVLDSGNAQNVTLNLKAGSYAVVCFLSDRDGGKPHVAKGMIKQVDIQ